MALPMIWQQPSFQLYNNGKINNFALLHFLCLLMSYYFIFFMRNGLFFVFTFGSIIERLRGHKYCGMLIDLARPRAYSWPHCLLAVLLWTNFWTTLEPSFFSTGDKAFLIGFWEMNGNSQRRKTAQWSRALKMIFPKDYLSILRTGMYHIMTFWSTRDPIYHSSPIRLSWS